ncbi:MAG TPA: ABC transporter ATP-binding protein [Candidatus Acidoferrales bacterium]|jgi:oligopeptide transport system ATP-binding protein|nr:ABC transporter ATP-binding protein [Candidatus Acidoferrales bacterium]
MKTTRPLLRVEELTKRFIAPRGTADANAVTALDRVSLSIYPGETLALVGESGSGKSTLGLCLACLERPSSGRIWFEGRDVASLRERDLRAVRPQIQLIFQDAAAAMNPRLNACEIITEPLLVRGVKDARRRLERTRELLSQVGMDAAHSRRGLAELSGGQRQRLAIARALAAEPKLLIFDESFSALDCSLQAQMANLLMELQEAFDIAYLFISHDLAMAAHLADRIAVMERGRIVESGTVEAIVRGASHPCTRALLQALPTPEGLITA